MSRQAQIALARHRSRQEKSPPAAAPADAPQKLSPAAELLAQLLESSVSAPDYNCDEGRHEPQAIRVASSREPLGYFCVRCRARCDADGRLSQQRS